MTTEIEDRISHQLRGWRESLIDLSKRQKLLYFKHLRVGTLEIQSDSLADLYGRVNSTSLVLTPGKDEDGTVIAPRGGDTLYCPNVTEKAIQNAATALLNKARDVSTGQGVWSLHLGLGMLHWNDPVAGEKPESPVLMIPVDMKRDGVGKPWKVAVRDEEVQFNPALRLKLREFDITVPDEDEAESPVDLLAELAGQLPAGWELRDRAVLANFSFPKLAMFYDLRDNYEQILNHPLVQMLAVGSDAPAAQEFPFEARPLSTLDTYRPLGSSMSVLDADSSQRQCVAAALDGESFVMDGPPGTGKSQTITNIIAELIAVGKSVLFVSEKVAALEVVEKRLAESGLGHLVLNLHGDRTRKEVAQHLAETLTTSVVERSRMNSGELGALADSIDDLTNFAAAMNENRTPLGRSLISAIGEVDRRVQGIALPPLSSPVDVERLDDKALREAEKIAGRYAESQSEFNELTDPVWVGLAASTHSRNEVNLAKLNTRQAVDALTTVLDAVSTLDEEFDLPPAANVYELGQRLRLADLMWAPRRVPFEWFATEMASIADRLDEIFALRDRCVVESQKLDASLKASWRSCDARNLHERLSAALEPLNGQWNASSARAAAAELGSCVQRLTEMEDALGFLVRAFGVEETAVTGSQVAQLVDLAELATNPNRPPAAWFDPARLPQISAAVEAIGEAARAEERARAAATEFFLPSLLDEDLRSLAQRFAAHKGSVWSKPGRADRKLLKQHTVSGKAPKGLILQLPCAVQWQEAANRLLAECERAALILGFAPDPGAESVENYSSALELVQAAVQIAGLTVPLGSVAEQLASDGTPSPTLLPAAQAVREHRSAVQSHLENSGVRGLVENWNTLPIDTSVQEITRTLDSLWNLAGVLDESCQALSLGDEPGEDSARVLSLLTRIIELGDNEADLQERLDQLGLSNPRGLDRDELLADLEWAEAARDAVGRRLGREDYEALYRVPRFSADVNDALAAYRAAVGGFLTMFTAERRHELAEELAGSPSHCIDLLANASDEAARVIPLVDNLVECRSFIDEQGLGGVADFCMDKAMEASKVADILVGALLDSWIDQVSLSDPRLERWRSFERNQLVATFANLDQQLVQSAYSRIVRAYNDRVRGVAQESGAQVIIRESEKKTRHLPIRKLLERSTDVIQLIKPCMMMSPLTVSNYVPATTRFDVVVFDEASQVKPEDAVNCIYRGRQLIVAGDQKQLPPTSFFSGADDESDEELDDFESVLDSAKAAGLTPLPLTWHYRSRHESLIAFSNRAFYKGRLLTFPSATYEADDLGVSFHRAHGVYRRGTSRDNPIEAAKVAERVRFFVENYPDLSVGVVTMSEAQRTAVQGAMERLAQESPAIGSLLNSGAGIDDFFVKALENVQGDERDVIIMSIGYGPDEHGKFTMNFGPLNKKGGWRRLNVAITRARRRLEVVASFEYDQLIPGENETLRHFRRFMNYAQNGSSVFAIDSEDSLGGTESVFEEQVLAQIESWGYEVVPQVGVAGYRIDMAVRHPDRPGTYALGIECDGAAYHSAPTARDRDRLRHAVLEGLGWRLHRIWGLSWWRDRDNQVAALKLAIENAISDLAPAHEVHVSSVGGTAAVDAVELDFGASTDQDEPADEAQGDRSIGEGRDTDSLPTWVRPYAFAEIAPSVRDGVTYSAFFTALLEEAPVSQNRMYEILKASLGVARLKPTQQAQVVAEIDRDSRFTRDERGFVHVVGKPVNFFRTPANTGVPSVVPQISDPELRFAVQELVAEHLIIDCERLVEEVVRIAGDQQITRPARRIIEKVIEQCHLDGSLTIDDDGTIS